MAAQELPDDSQESLGFRDGRACGGAWVIAVGKKDEKVRDQLLNSLAEEGYAFFFGFTIGAVGRIIRNMGFR